MTPLLFVFIPVIIFCLLYGIFQDALPSSQKYREWRAGYWVYAQEPMGCYGERHWHRYEYELDAKCGQYWHERIYMEDYTNLTTIKQ